MPKKPRRFSYEFVVALEVILYNIFSTSPLIVFPSHPHPFPTAPPVHLSNQVARLKAEDCKENTSHDRKKRIAFETGAMGAQALYRQWLLDGSFPSAFSLNT